MPSGGGGHTPLGRRGAQAIEIHDSTRNAAIGKKPRAFSTYATTGSLLTLKIPIRQIKVFRALVYTTIFLSPNAPTPTNLRPLCSKQES